MNKKVINFYKEFVCHPKYYAIRKEGKVFIYDKEFNDIKTTLLYPQPMVNYLMEFNSMKNLDMDFLEYLELIEGKEFLSYFEYVPSKIKEMILDENTLKSLETKKYMTDKEYNKVYYQFQNFFGSSYLLQLFRCSIGKINGNANVLLMNIFELFKVYHSYNFDGFKKQIIDIILENIVSHLEEYDKKEDITVKIHGLFYFLLQQAGRRAYNQAISEYAEKAINCIFYMYPGNSFAKHYYELQNPVS